jgi:hypothetical protein
MRVDALGYPDKGITGIKGLLFYYIHISIVGQGDIMTLGVSNLHTLRETVDDSQAIESNLLG